MQNDYIIQLGGNAGLTALDIALICLSPICGALGILVSSALRKVQQEPKFKPARSFPISLAMENRDRSRTPEEDLQFYNEKRREAFEEALARHQKAETGRLAFIGLVLGLTVSLYFVGALTNSVTSLARVLALAVLLGYQAPNIWAAQERVLRKVVEDRVRKIIGSKSEESSNTVGRADS